MDGRGPGSWAIPHCLPMHVTEGQDWKRDSWDLNVRSKYGMAGGSFTCCVPAQEFVVLKEHCFFQNLIKSCQIHCTISWPLSRKLVKTHYPSVRAFSGTHPPGIWGCGLPHTRQGAGMNSTCCDPTVRGLLPRCAPDTRTASNMDSQPASYLILPQGLPVCFCYCRLTQPPSI